MSQNLIPTLFVSPLIMYDDNFDDFSPLNKKKKTPVKKERKASDGPTSGSSQSSKSRRKLSPPGGKSKKKTTASKRKSSSQGKAESSTLKEQTSTSRIERNSGYVERCPICQMPLSLLRIQSPEWHVTECLSSPFSSTNECPAGAKCDCTIISHYKKFQHTALSELSNNSQTNEDTSCNCNGLFEGKEATMRETAIKKEKTGIKKEIKEEKITSNCELDDMSRTSDYVTATCSQSDYGSQKHVDDKLSHNDIKISQDNDGTGTTNYASDEDIFGCESTYDVVMDDIDDDEIPDGSGTNCNESKQDSEQDIFYRNDTGQVAEDNIADPIDVKYDTVDDPQNLFTIKNEIKTEVDTDIKTENTDCQEADDELFDDNDDDLEAAAGSDGCDDDDDIGENEDDDCDYDNDIKTEVLENDHEPESILSSQVQSQIKQETSADFGLRNDTQSFVEMSDIDFNESMEENHEIKQNASVSSSQGSMHQQFRSSQNSPSKYRTTPNKSNKQNIGRSQSSILSFFGGKGGSNVGNRKSVSLGPETTNRPSNIDIKPNANSYPNLNLSSINSQVKNLTDPSAAKNFMKQFNRAADTSKTLNDTSKSTSSNYRGKSFNYGKGDGGDSKASGYKRTCPFYKKIPGTNFTVDAFSYGTIPGCTSYFLSHFHYDHYQGLGKRFMHPIYCSQVTANLVKKKINVDSRYINALKMNHPTRIDGIEVTLLEANHCPGSVLFLFSLPDGSSVLHTGDFRADPSMESYPELKNVAIKQLYLDTTYCDAAYAFPPQQEVIKATIEVARNHFHYNPNTLVAVGAYTIGKERIFLAVAEEFNLQVCVSKEKQRILECQDNPIVNKRMTTIAQGAKLHVLPMRQLNYRDLTAYLEKFKGIYDNILAFEPTGWTHSRGASSDILKLQPKVNRNGITIYGVPYSEHSSFLELKRFVQWCRPQKIIPTVNVGSPSSRAKMEKYFKTWLSEQPTPTAKQTNLGSFFKQR